LWVYDLRTNQNFTFRTNPLTRAHLDDFGACYHPETRYQRQESERFRSLGYDELLKRDKVGLDLGGTGSLVVLLHGFPELWHSWRHQLPALADADHHAVALDLRGYGETDAPKAIEDR